MKSACNFRVTLNKTEGCYRGQVSKHGKTLATIEHEGSVLHAKVSHFMFRMLLMRMRDSEMYFKIFFILGLHQAA